ncbi:enhancer of split m6 protein [Scaptodrosophila lebanonensis]|uniref:Enhancer of split m6 protein n=1 Tax=Drosophila lebanonensis TaxID=7225 RepID=A0A6J2TIL6_DROLE|nr:enhancer of split m6 protein [Scaptodrosophila lebanonensis]
MFKVKVLIAKMLHRYRKCSNNTYKCPASYEEIAQNQANERMMQAAAQQLVFCLETAAGSFYWHANAATQ